MFWQAVPVYCRLESRRNQSGYVQIIIGNFKQGNAAQ
jgi:hypothetical protein